MRSTPVSEPRRHRVVPVPVIFHDDGQICPLSIGKSSCPFDHLESSENSNQEIVSVPNLRRLLASFQRQQRLSRVSSLPSLNARLVAEDSAREQRYYANDEELLCERAGTDSGVGDSSLSNASVLGHVLSKNSKLWSNVSSDNDEDDTLASLPSPSVFRRFERKQKLGVAFLSSVTPQQMANLAPDLKESMDNFINQLELHGMKPGQTSRSSSRMAATPGLAPSHSDSELLMMDKPNNASETNSDEAVIDLDTGPTLSDIYIGSKFSYEPLDQPYALYSQIPAKSANYHRMPERARLSEDAHRERLMRREAEERRSHLTAKLRYLKGRSEDLKIATSARLNQLAALYRERLESETERAGPLERACLALHEKLDALHRQRLEALETKLRPIVVKGGPSKKANHQIAAARLHYEIYVLTARLGHMLIRLEHEEQRREMRESEVRRLRSELSEKRTAITTLTKGIPFSRIEVRPHEQLPPHHTHWPAPKSSKLSAASMAAIANELEVGHKRSDASVAAVALADSDTDDDETRGLRT